MTAPSMGGLKGCFTLWLPLILHTWFCNWQRKKSSVNRIITKGKKNKLKTFWKHPQILFDTIPANGS